MADGGHAVAEGSQPLESSAGFPIPSSNSDADKGVRELPAWHGRQRRRVSRRRADPGGGSGKLVGGGTLH